MSSSNYAAPGAHVGMQVDGDVVIEGGLSIDMSGVTFGRPAGGKGRGDRETVPVQEGDENTASGNQTVGVQAGRVSGRRHGR